jgi:hypothetical protein
MPEDVQPPRLHILQFFTYEHLPAHLQAISRPFGEAARSLAAMTPEAIEIERDLARRSHVNTLSALCADVDGSTPANEEATWAVVKIGEANTLLGQGVELGRLLRLLLEAKDCAVRAVLAK